jgi:cytochrome c-type biogenesis protein
MTAELVALFGAGVAAIVSPCSIVLVPAYLGMLTGNTAGTDCAARPRLIVATLLFGAGFTSVFVTLGVIAGGLAGAAGSIRHWLTIAGGLLLVVFGMLKLGARIPLLQREVRVVNRVPGARHAVQPVVFGIGFGAAWSPCAGPLLGAALTAAAQNGHAAGGAVLLLAYAAGTGTAFVAATLGILSAPGFSRALRRLAPALERAAGAVILIAGLALLTGTYTQLTDWLQHFSPRVGGL